MCVELYKHNIEPYNKIIDSIKAGNKKVAVSHATGTGKTYLISKLFEDYSDEKKLVLVPLNYIRKNMSETFEGYSIKNTDIMLYQSLVNKTPEELASMDYQKIVLDEFHHVTSDVWGDRVGTLINTHPDSVVFGTSATPVRTDGVDAIEELFDGNCVSELSMAEAIVEKILPMPKYIAGTLFVDAKLKKIQDKAEKSGWTSEEKKEFARTIAYMRSHIEESYGMPTILSEHIKDKNGKYLVFCKNKTHLRKMRKVVIEWFKIAGFNNINDYAVYSDYSDKDTDFDNFQKDTSDNLKLLFCINMLNEGLHLKDISGAMLLRTTGSHIVFRQQIGRVLSSSNNSTPIIIDAVSNSNFIDGGIDLLKEVREAIQQKEKTSVDFNGGDFKNIDAFFITGHIQDIYNILNKLDNLIPIAKVSWDDWMYWYKKLCQYDDVKTIHSKDKSLYNWIEWQKQRYRITKNPNLSKKYVKPAKPLSEEQILMLARAGVQLEIDDDFFGKMLLEAENYYAKTGQIRAPKGTKLSSWERNQVVLFNKGKLTEDKISQLKSIGFVFDAKKYYWNRNIEALKKYYDSTGKITIDKNEKKLSIFVRSLGNQYKNGTLSAEQISQLNKIGHCFEAKTELWNLAFGRLCEFSENNQGRMPRSREKSPDGYSIGCWYYDQIRKYKKGNMPKYQIEKLKSVGAIN